MCSRSTARALRIAAPSGTFFSRKVFLAAPVSYMFAAPLTSLAEATSVHTASVHTLEAKVINATTNASTSVPLSSFKGKVLLVVNVASC